MQLKKAEAQDLAPIRATFSRLVDAMRRDGIMIWDDIYPNEIFAEDVEQGRLYVLYDGDTVVSAFALCCECSGQDAVEWREKDAYALYLFRLGVNVDYLRRGIGSLMIKESMRLTSELGAKYLRLFVVDSNKPAIDMYFKNGFWQAEGAYDQTIGDRCLHEFGFEIDV